jgi:hypothetical protein
MAGQLGNQSGLSHQESFNIVYALARAHATCFLPFLRKGFGSEALAWPGLIALVIMLVVGSFNRIHDMWFFLGFWALAMVYQRANIARDTRRGVIRHSQYAGDVDEKAVRIFGRAMVKQIIEPLCCLLVGVCVEAMGASHKLAMFISSGAFSLALVAMIDRQLEYKRLQAMRDAAIEQRYLAARFRGEIDD